ncbi:MAG: hypothetical protein GXN91_00070 [Epsilonproteobacteria bacterium]|nr:hypothetical protein [Campylobacterota bacterium]
MLIFGFKDINSPNFIKVNSKEDILKTTPKDIIILDEVKEPYNLLKYCASNEIPYGILTSSIKEAIIANHFNASYIIGEFEFAKEIQKIADEYLWDTKVLALISNEDEVEIVAKAFIDGAIIKKYIKGL